MLYRCLSAPFSDPARQRLFDAAAEALQAESAGPDSLLVGNLALATAEIGPLDAVVMRPHGITLLVFVPRGGRLSIPALGYGSWLLDGAPFACGGEFDNPFEQFIQQRMALETWLSPRLSPEQANLRFISGIVVFGGPVTFGPDVEPSLNSAAANGFQLLTNPAELPRRLRQLASPEIDLSEEDLAEWAATLAPADTSQPAEFEATNENAFANPASQEDWAEEGLDEEIEPAGQPAPQPLDGSKPANFLSQKARQLWGWLGADDIPDDVPYGYSSDALAARSEEKERLEQIRLQMQADVAAQLQAMEARETERERSIAQLRTALAQAPAVAPEAEALAARLAAENREKAAMEAAMQASRAESASRNQELDAKIQQLSQLIERLSAQPAAEPASPTPPTADSPPAAAAATEPPKPSGINLAALRPALVATASPWFRQLRVWRRRLPRLTVVAGVVAIGGFGVWGLSHLGSTPPVPYQENGKWGFADGKGQPVIPAQFTSASPFQAGRAVVARDHSYGFVDEAGKEVVPPAYDALNAYAGGYARARVGDAYTFIDEDGEEFGNYYFNARDFAGGHAAVLDHRGWYYITGPTEPAKPVIFQEAHSFADGLARVKLTDGYTFITADYLDDPSEGTAPFGRYEQAADFVDGHARVTQKGRSFLIDRRGEVVK
ncbi:WG repeat-containing protein [Hymenobacter sp. BT770]|uniref:WG repeat-containing protein n=1 Tax=Hymenobacter sp. BT770 TaxID=2886942 RepID=UPI001D117010|nr:WG repeat-containing protein [Hymenobacter sp. BT770]MCC3152286.1 WG repeat-containing protein [Hymenobacter sp. BT770]MDO3414099.1 WG repeat-containing protein [Hymenobacter sp. BT770]